MKAGLLHGVGGIDYLRLEEISFINGGMDGDD